MKKGGLLASVKKDIWLYIFLVPFILWYLVFAYRPMSGLVIAFKDYSLFTGIKDSPWVGLDNFKEFFGGAYFGRTLKNTLILNLMGLAIGFPIPIILAILLNEVKSKYIKKTVQTATYLPYFISIVVVAGMVSSFLSPTSGIVNILIEKLGGDRIYFLTQKNYFRWIYIIMYIWKDTGYNAIVFLAALSSVDMQLYEACRVDGGNKWKQIVHITLPGIMPTIIIMLILKIGGMMEIGYEAIILLYQPSTYETADVISTYVYRTGLLEGNYGIATAAGIFNSVVGMILVIAANRFSKKVTETSLW